MKKVLQRLKEPSTWAGLSVLAMLFGVDPDKAQAVVNLAAETHTYFAAAASVAAVLLGEQVKAD